MSVFVRRGGKWQKVRTYSARAGMKDTSEQYSAHALGEAKISRAL
jgi:hypothetical protein